MMIRTAATVLAMLCVVQAYAEDPNADQFLAGHPTEPAAATVRSADGFELDAPVILRDRKPVLSMELNDKINSLFQSGDREFPFSPRLVRQSNYDIQISDEPLLSEEFRMMLERNTALRFQLFNGRAEETTVSGPAKPTPTKDEGVSIIFLTAGESDDSAANAVIVAGGSTADACTETACTHGDDEPIDVELADGDTACKACTAKHACDDGCPEATTAQAPEIPPAAHSQAAELPNPLPIPGLIPGQIAAAHAAPEACAQPEPPLKAKVEHLLEAARHLAGAGYEEEAKLFRVEAEAIERASNRLLAEKRHELERLQREIAELELLTGQYDLIQLDFSVLEIALPTDCDAQACSPFLDQPGMHVLTSQGSSSTSSVSAQVPELNLVEFLKGLETCGCSAPVKVFAPKIVTTNGRTASISNGGSFVIPVASEARGDAKAGLSHDMRRYGIDLQALPVVLGNDRVRLNLVAEISERDFSNAVNLNRTAVPGLTTRRCNTTVETRFGDIVAVSFNSPKRADGDRKCMLVLVTPQRVNPLDDRPAAE